MSRADLDAQRALFEAWMRKECGATDESLQWARAIDMWAAWQAALAAQAPVQGEPLASDVEDAARLDWLESMGNDPEGILLHDGGDFTGRRGLGLRRIGRTIRAAIDAARKAGT